MKLHRYVHIHMYTWYWEYFKNLQVVYNNF
jgi:hypothetical protein